MPILLAALALLVALVHAVVYFRGDRRRDLRRCPTCRYDMARVPAMTCPECGGTAPSEARFHYTRRKRRFAAMATFWLLIAAGIFIAGAVRHGGVLGMLPRPVLAWLLERAVPVPPTPVGADIPTASSPSGTPTPARPSPRLWARLSWNQGYVHAIRAWGDLVATDDPAKVLANLPRMHAALAEMDAWKQYHNSTAFIDSWLVMAEIDRQRQRIETHLTRSVTIPGSTTGAATISLDRNELLMLAFQPPRNQCEGIGLGGGPYIAAPQPYLAAMATIANPDSQRYALERLGPEPAGAVDIDALIVSVEQSAADRPTRDMATTVRTWRTGFINRKSMP